MSNLTGTKLVIAQAALETLRLRGYAGASAREIARAGDINQALVFYHFGSVQNALLAALDLVSDLRMQSYAEAIEGATTPADLSSLVMRIRQEDTANGYVVVLGEMIAAGVTDAELGSAVFARIEPWIDLAERKIRQTAGDRPLGGAAAPRDLAFAFIALYLGVDLLGNLDDERASADAVISLAAGVTQGFGDVALEDGGGGR
jgi:AcrR family transcriptional regulator